MHENWVNLLKYPLTVVISISSIIGGCYILGVKPSNVQWGDVEVDFRNDITKKVINQHLGINESIENEVKKQLIKYGLDTAIFLNEVSHIPVNEIVPDKIADLAKIKTEKGIETVYKSTVGYIWTGNFHPETGQFSKIKLNADNLNDIQVGESFYVNGNMVIRENSPVNNVNYFKGEDRIGLAVKGTKVKLLEKPHVKKLGIFDQYWAKIEVLE